MINPEYHTTVLLRESVEMLDLKDSGFYADLTYGAGGHSKLILENSSINTLLAFDQDFEAKRNIVQDERLVFVNHNFRFLSNYTKFHSIPGFDGIIADLGISSHHIDNENRGFAFRYNSKLDMRMNQNKSKTAKDILNSYTDKQLIEIFRTYSELKNAGQISKAICKERESSEIETTFQLNNIVSKFAPRNQENKFLAKIYQAIRIELNDEIQSLKEVLQQSIALLNPGGRFVIISYHSIEDKLVKHFFRSGNFEGIINKDLYGNSLSPFRIITKKVITPDQEEIERNSRARSAKLRVAEKI